jgi:hypothetical protein
VSDVLAQYNIRTIGMSWYSPEAWQQLRAMPAAKIQMTYFEFVRNVSASLLTSRHEAFGLRRFPLKSVRCSNGATGRVVFWNVAGPAPKRARPAKKT